MNQADEAWVQELYRYNAPKLYKVVLRRLADAEAAQDIVQEMFLDLMVASSRGSPGRLTEGASSNMKWTCRGSGPWWI